MELLVNIDVADLDMAIRFYERAVGLQPGRRLFEGLPLRCVVLRRRSIF